MGTVETLRYSFGALFGMLILKKNKDKILIQLEPLTQMSISQQNLEDWGSDWG
jgi:alpha/beta superfamily hydrolase